MPWSISPSAQIGYGRLPAKYATGSKTNSLIADVARLQGASQVIACVKIINDALQELRGEADVLVCAVDEEERCYVASETQAAIQGAWHAIVAAAVRDTAAGMKAVRPTCPPPYSVVAALPSLAASSEQPAANPRS